MTDKRRAEIAFATSQAITREDYVPIVVGNKRYVLFPPTIHMLCHAQMCMGEMDYTIQTIKDALMKQNNLMAGVKALSWLIDDSDKLVEELSNGTLDEIAMGIALSLQMVGIENFLMLSGMKKSMDALIANPKS